MRFDFQKEEDIDRISGENLIYFIWNSKEVTLQTKINFCQSTPLNRIPWGSENWSEKKGNLAMIEVFNHKAIRHKLSASIMRSKEEDIINDGVRRRFGGFEKMENVWRKR